MAYGTKGHILKEKSMEKGNFIDLMILFMKEILLIIILREKGDIFFLTKENI
jgi:hypothetical protein